MGANYVVKIINNSQTGSQDIVKRTHVLDFDSEDSREKFIRGLRDEYDIIKDGQNEFSYFNPREDAVSFVSLEECGGNEISKLDKNQVWSMLYSNKKDCLESMVADFKDTAAVKSFMENRSIQDKYTKVLDIRRGLNLYINDLGVPMYATNIDI